MTKVLALKRPSLIPMVDSYVMGFLFKSEWPPEATHYDEAALIGIQHFAELLERHRSVITAISDDLNRWLAKEASDSVTLSPSRVLESLLWFDYAGYKNFAGWKARKHDVQRA